MTRIGRLFALLLAWQITTGDSLASDKPISFSGPIEGRIVDAHSGRPIDGAIVVAFWEGQYSIGYGHSSTVTVCYETALTESTVDGSYSFDRTKIIPPLHHHTRYVRLLVYKPGYWPAAAPIRSEPEPPVSELLKRGPPFRRIELLYPQISLESFSASKSDRLKYLNYLSSRAYNRYPKCAYRKNLQDARYRFDLALYDEAASLAESIEDRNIVVSLGSKAARSYLNGNVPPVLTFLDREGTRSPFYGAVFDDDLTSIPATTLTREQVDHILAGQIKQLQAYTELKRAIVQRDNATTRNYLAKGVDVNLVDGYRYPLLRHALQSNQGETILLLLKHGANLDRTEGGEALSWAARNDDTVVASYLLEHGVGPDSLGLDRRPALHVAAFSGSAGVTKLLLQYGANFLTPLGDNNSVLEIAVEQNHSQIVQILLDNKADPNTRNRHGFPLAMLAMHLSKYSVAKVLLDGGADPNIVGPQGQTLLDVAAENGELTIAELLLRKGADINAKHGSALGVACYHGQEAMVEFLLRNKARTDGEYGRRAMNLALSYKSKAKIVSMLLDSGVKVDSDLLVNHASTTPASIIKLLQERGINTNVRASEQGRTPLMSAAMYGNEDVVSSLLKTGADSRMKDNDGRTAVMHATLYAARSRKFGTLLRLIDARADVNAKDNMGQTALMLAIDHGQTALLADPEYYKPTTRPSPPTRPKTETAATIQSDVKPAARKLEAELNRKTYSEKPLHMQPGGGGATALSPAVATPRPYPSPGEWRRTILPAPDLVRLLLENGADPKPRDATYGWTALMRAAAFDFPEIVRLLLKAGADTATKDLRGRTARDIAVTYDSSESLAIIDGRERMRQEQR